MKIVIQKILLMKFIVLKFNTFGNVVSEKEAMMLYRAVLKNSNNKNANLVYIPIFRM